MKNQLQKKQDGKYKMLKSKGYLIFLVSIAVFLIDRIIKNYIVKRVESIKVIANIFHITYVKNYGVGFGLLQNQTLFIIIISFLVLFAIAYYYRKIPDKMYVQTAIALIIGGTLGNLFDRLSFGYVIDYLDFRIWPVFNLADGALVVGVCFLVYYLWTEEK